MLIKNKKTKKQKNKTSSSQFIIATIMWRILNIMPWHSFWWCIFILELFFMFFLLLLQSSALRIFLIVFVSLFMVLYGVLFFVVGFYCEYFNLSCPHPESVDPKCKLLHKIVYESFLIFFVILIFFCSIFLGDQKYRSLKRTILGRLKYIKRLFLTIL